MKEYELEVLEQYDIEVKNIKRGRNSFLLDTDRGLCIVQNTGMSERRGGGEYGPSLSAFAGGWMPISG